MSLLNVQNDVTVRITDASDDNVVNVVVSPTNDSDGVTNSTTKATNDTAMRPSLS
jgi:hypothetical protein